MHPAVAEVIDIYELVKVGLHQEVKHRCLACVDDLIANLVVILAGNPHRPVVAKGTLLEHVQMVVPPSESLLDGVVQVMERKLGRNLNPSPHGRLLDAANLDLKCQCHIRS